MKTRLALKVIRNYTEYRESMVVSALIHLHRRGRIDLPVKKFTVRCPIDNTHEFYRGQDGVSHYHYIDISTGITNYRCIGKHSTRPFGPDSCGQTPVWASGFFRSYRQSRRFSKAVIRHSKDVR